jgi:MTH538 TIR-like domain (DUF1863)
MLRYVSMPTRDRRHVFISHHHKDDADVDSLTDLLKKRGHDVRNSSIRANPKNQERLDKGLVKDETIRRLLRMKISWAGAVIVLIGKDTHSRPWVNWEIEQANKQGKRIIGVYTRGGTEADIPPSFEDCGDALVAWNTDSIIDALDGTSSPFEGPGGGPRRPVHVPTKIRC